MTDQLLMIKKEDCTWGSLTQYEFLHKFDTTLEKACTIAEKKVDNFGRQIENDLGDEIYFVILEYL